MGIITRSKPKSRLPFGGAARTARRERERLEHERLARERAEREAAQRAEAERRRKAVKRFVILAAVLILVGGAITGLVQLMIANGVRAAEQLKVEGAEFANTERVYSTSSVPLEKRVDGSYYEIIRDEVGGDRYRYTTVGASGEISAGEVSDQPVWTFFGRQFTREVKVTVKVIGDEDDSQQPRVERSTCSVRAIDSKKPSYTGDPYASTRFEPGSSKPLARDDEPGIFQMFQGYPTAPVCVDKAVFYVPTSTTQP